MIDGEICRDQALVHSGRRRKEFSHPVRGAKEATRLAVKGVNIARHGESRSRTRRRPLISQLWQNVTKTIRSEKIKERLESLLVTRILADAH